MAEKNKSYQDKEYNLDIVFPWEADLGHPDLRWANYSLKDKNTPNFVFSEPSPLMKSRIEFLVSQFCTKSRRWVICFSDSVTYMRLLSEYTAATFILSTRLSAEVKGPKDIIDFAFNLNASFNPFIDPPIQTCSLLILSHFDCMYPGFQKAKSKIIELLIDRKIQKRPFMFTLYSSTLPTSSNDIAKFSAPLVDYFGEQARDLFSDTLTKFVILKGE